MTAVAAIGLGGAGCRFLAELPPSRDQILHRIAMDCDPVALRSLAAQDVDARLHVALPRAYRKKPVTEAYQQIDSAFQLRVPTLHTLFPEPSLVLLCVALGGISGTRLAVTCSEALAARGHRLVSLVLWPLSPAADGSARDQALAHLAKHSLSLCLVNTTAVSAALPDSTPVQRALAMTGVLRLGHAMDWEHLRKHLSGDLQ